MSYSVLPIPPFDRQLKRLVKKYSSLKEEYLILVESLELNPEQGIKLRNNCYKIRLAVSSKGKGKRGGARVITCFVIANETVYLLAIFDKSDKENLTDRELNKLLEQVSEL